MSGSTTTQSTQSVLLARLRAGEQDAYRDLLTWVKPLVERWCRRLQLNPSDAQDVSQESLVAVFQHIEKFERRPHHGGFRAWLWTILFRKAADLRRRDAKQMTLGDAVDALAVETDCCEDSPPEPEPEERNDFLGAVLRTVRVRCTERSWNAFLLTAMNGLTSVDAGERLGMTAEAVRRAKSRVLAMIRAELGILEGRA